MRRVASSPPKCCCIAMPSTPISPAIRHSQKVRGWATRLRARCPSRKHVTQPMKCARIIRLMARSCETRVATVCQTIQPPRSATIQVGAKGRQRVPMCQAPTAATSPNPRNPNRTGQAKACHSSRERGVSTRRSRMIGFPNFNRPTPSSSPNSPANRVPASPESWVAAGPAAGTDVERGTRIRGRVAAWPLPGRGLPGRWCGGGTGCARADRGWRGPGRGKGGPPHAGFPR
jgi:hypothetical protein